MLQHFAVTICPPPPQKKGDRKEEKKEETEEIFLAFGITYLMILPVGHGSIQRKPVNPEKHS